MQIQEYVELFFERNFSKYKEKNIVLYGTGPNTVQILKCFKDFNIVGLLDPSKEGQEIQGKKVISLNDLSMLEIDIIIVIAKLDSCKIIYKRIESFCRLNQIALYGINGKELNDFFSYRTGLNNNDKKFFSLRKEGLKEKILNSDIIIFAIWDILLMQKSWSIEDFYVILRNSCSQDYITSVEYSKLLVLRQSMFEMFLFAKKQKKKIYLFSDKKIEKKLLIEILGDFSITGYDKLILLSHDQEPVLHFNHAQYSKKILRIDLHSKWQNRIVSGAELFLIKSAKEMLQVSSYRDLEQRMENINERSIAGLFVSKIFNDPFELEETNGRRKVESAYDIGWFFLGGLAVGFILWFIETIYREKYAGILFGARDGYLMQKIYTIVKEILQLENLPRDEYFLTSRLLCWKASVHNRSDILRIIKESNVASPENILKRIFEVPVDYIQTYNKEEFFSVENYVYSYEDIIYEKSFNINENYQKYINRFDFKIDGKYVFFDFVSRGACQCGLRKLLPCKVEGLYVCRHHRYEDPEPEKEIIHGYIEEIHSYMPQTYLYTHYGDAEYVFSAPVPSIRSMDKNGNPIHFDETRSKAEMSYLLETQRGVLDFVIQFFSDLYDKNAGTVKSEFVDKIYSYCSLTYTNEQCREKDDLMHEDALCMSRSFWAKEVQSTRRV